jgi:hypothetical protein
MTKVLIMPVLAAVLFAGACGDDPVEVDTRGAVRFFNAMTGMTANGGFTTNGQFANGSALGFAQSSQTCTRLDAGSTTFGFGAANTGGTALSGTTLATLANQSIVDGGNYTVVATGNGVHALVFMLDNNFAGTLGSNQAAIRFVSFAPQSPTAFNVLNGTIETGPTTVFATNLALGVPTEFKTVSSGSNPFTILQGHDIAISGSPATFTLQGGSVNTIAIVPNTSGDFQLISIPRCS